MSSVVVHPAATVLATSVVDPHGVGRCGPSIQHARCNAIAANDDCCFSDKHCASTSSYCEVANDCVSGCSFTFPAATVIYTRPGTTAAVASLAASNANANWTAFVTQEPVIAPASRSPSATSARLTTGNGTCGAQYGNTTCGDWSQGSCCSMYGFCGDTIAHCGDGCQSGPCIDDTEVQAPSPSPAPPALTPGSFAVVGRSGVPAMHAGLMPNGKVVFLDKVENYTGLRLRNGLNAYSSEYDPITNSATALSYQTNAFCSGGSFLANGTMISVGGNGPLIAIDPTIANGFDAIRYITRSSTDASLDGKDWVENDNKLNSKRWYASVQMMADGTLFVASGSRNGLDPIIEANNNPTYEILNAAGITQGRSIPMEILMKSQPYYMYPFLHLLSNGGLFVFVSNASEVFDVATNTTIRTFADLPGDYRTYPNTGGSVLLPLSSNTDWDPDILICGGGPYQDITATTDASCGRIRPLSVNAEWEMDSMPEGRVMVEGINLPDGTVVWVNGANRGAQGFGLAEDPTLEVLLYDPAARLGKRWTTGGSSKIARLYHSVALLLLDGTLMISGSNPVEQPILESSKVNPYVTDFRVEIYTPPYLQGDNAKKRATNVTLSSTALKANSQSFTASFTVPKGAEVAKISLYHGGFVTHSLHMGHRMVFLDFTGWIDGGTFQTITVKMPPTNNIAPPGPYVIYVVVDGVPAMGQFVMVA